MDTFKGLLTVICAYLIVLPFRLLLVLNIISHYGYLKFGVWLLNEANRLEAERNLSTGNSNTR